MINSSEFSDRIDRMLKFYDLTASAFADKIGVQRSSISHLLAGRNKPSLEFVMRVVQTFPEVDLHWLINGKGGFPAKMKLAVSIPQEAQSQPMDTGKVSVANPGTIEKIIIFYSDGSFKAYSEK
ncbi:MAG TPA: helix-turn-helix transcriptional regulator [Arenibacter sp.]|nr:helix-turn-helix transcriptional regulator [Arenibacter sp.]